MHVRNYLSAGKKYFCTEMSRLIPLVLKFNFGSESHNYRKFIISKIFTS